MLRQTKKTKSPKASKSTFTKKHTKAITTKTHVHRSVVTKAKAQRSVKKSPQQLNIPHHTQIANSASLCIKDFKSKFPTESVGAGLDYRLFFFDENGNPDDLNTAISPWHDIPLINNDATIANNMNNNGKPKDLIFNFICEIPKGTTAKFELNTKTANNPIKQDVKNGQLRHFKYGTIPFNYGALPQTWEDPKHIDSMMKLGGDNDPVDIVEMSPGPLQHGVVYPVKIVGALALIDEGEVDWKLLAIDANHPIAPKLQDVHHLDAFLPSFEVTLKNWFKNYKTAEGKGQNQFGYGDKLLNKAKAYEIVQQCHESWVQLCSDDKVNPGLATKPLPEGFHTVNLNH